MNDEEKLERMEHLWETLRTHWNKILTIIRLKRRDLEEENPGELIDETMDLSAEKRSTF
jgi:hypothetical protein